MNTIYGRCADIHYTLGLYIINIKTEYLSKCTTIENIKLMNAYKSTKFIKLHLNLKPAEFMSNIIYKLNSFCETNLMIKKFSSNKVILISCTIDDITSVRKYIRKYVYEPL